VLPQYVKISHTSNPIPETAMYKFKSRAAGDLIMLEPNGRQILGILGRSDAASLAQGILLPEHMPEAVAQLEAAIRADEAHRAQLVQEAQERGEVPPRFEGIALRQRALPFIEMIKRSLKEQKEIVWGV
jgi:Domain of unknown function (DUF1840)